MKSRSGAKSAQESGSDKTQGSRRTTVGSPNRMTSCKKNRVQQGKRDQQMQPHISKAKIGGMFDGRGLRCPTGT